MSADSNLVRRVGFAVVAIPLALVLVWYGGLPLALVLGVAGVLGARELCDLADRQGVRPIRPLGLLTAALLAPLAYAALTSPDVHLWVRDAWPYLAALWLITLLTWVLAVRRRPTGRSRLPASPCLRSRMRARYRFFSWPSGMPSTRFVRGAGPGWSSFHWS
jgi:CDP-diglyceride synthetase